MDSNGIEIRQMGDDLFFVENGPRVRFSASVKNLIHLKAAIEAALSLVAPSSVASESGEEAKRPERKTYPAHGSGFIVFYEVRSTDAYMKSIESENAILRDQIAAIKSQVLPQLKRDDQRYENWKKIQKP